MMGGILVATVLTIIVLPAAYALFFRVKLPTPAPKAVPACVEELGELPEAIYAAPAE
jgi:hypothetical protein